MTPKTKPLNELCTITKGKKVKIIDEPTKSSIPYLLINTLRGMEPICFTEDERYTEAIPSDILIVCDGANSGLVGTGIAGATGSTIARLRMNDSSEIDKDYFMHFLKSNFAKMNADIKGAAIPHLKQKEMLEMKIWLPKLPLQQKIVSAIETQFTRLDEAVKSLKAVKQKIGIYRKAVLKKAFEGALVENINFDKNSLLKEIEEFNKNKEGQNKVRRLPKISFKDLGSIPEGWMFVEAHKICSSVRDGTHDTPKYVMKGHPLITSKNLKNNLLDLTKISFISNQDFNEVNKRSKVDRGDILFAMIGTIGNPVEIKEEPNFAIKNVGLFKNKNEKFILTKYLRYWLESPTYFHILESKKLIKGTTQKFIDLGTLRISPIPICSNEEQFRIVSEIESKFSVIDKVEQAVNQSLTKAEQLRKSILKIAFEGRLVNEK